VSAISKPLVAELGERKGQPLWSIDRYVLPVHEPIERQPIVCPAQPSTLVDIGRPLVLVSSLAVGGAERVVVSFLSRLAERGVPVPVCTITSSPDSPLPAELDEVGVVRHELGARRLADPLSLLRYLRLLRRERIRLVHAHGQDAWILGLAGRFLSRVPLVLTRHVLDEPAENWRQAIRRRCALIAARRADGIIAPSSAAAQRLAELAGLPADNIRLIPNGLDLERVEARTRAARREDIRSALGFAPDQSLILFVSVLRPGKGHEVMLDALPQLRRDVPSARLVIVGSGERERELKAQARQAGDAVVFLGTRDDVPELLAACDLVVLPSFAETHPVTLIEAAAAGKPVVATRVGGVAEIVDDGVTGILVPPGDPVALAMAAARILKDPTHARALGETARVLSRRRFSLDLHVDRTLSFWSQVMAGPRRRAP